MSTSLLNTRSLNIAFFHTHSWLCFTNQSKTTTFVDIYEITCRDSTSQVDPIGLWEKGLSENERLKMDLKKPEFGSELEGAQKYFQTYRSTPFLSPPFCETYTIDKIFKVELPQGRSHIHESTYFLNDIPRSDRVEATSDGAIRDVAHYILIIVYGSPVMEIKAGPTTSSSCDISIIHDVAIHYAIPDDKTKSYFVSNSIQTAVGERFINPGSDQVDIYGN